MIHKPSAMGWGNADDFAKLIDELDRCQQSIIDIYMGRVKDGVTEEEINQKVNAETWMTGEEAQEIFDITVEQRPAMAACVSWMLNAYKNTPQSIQTQSIEDVAAKNAAERDAAEEAAILEELDLYGI